MSGQQIGTFVGGVIGAYFGNPQLGAAIGGFIGGAVDPTKVFGPRLSDATQQTAMDGVPRPYGMGTFPCTGNLIWIDPTVKEHKHKDDGKGSGQEQITYTYTRSYAIGVCKGPISGYKLVKRNGKVVFDARTDAELTALGYTSEQIAVTRAAQAKFLQKCTFYYGTADQTPDPTMVAVKGVGNVPGYSGTAYIVMTDDETNAGEVAQYEFVVANCGERTEDGIDPNQVSWLGTGQSGAGLFASVSDLTYAGALTGEESPVTSISVTRINGIERYGDYLFAAIQGNVATNLRVSSISDLGTWTDGPSSPNSDFNSYISVSGDRLFHFGYSPTVSYIESTSDTSWSSKTFSGGFTSNKIVSLGGNGQQVVAANGYGQLWGSNDNGDTFTLGALLFYPNRFYTSDSSLDCNGARFVVAGKDDSGVGAFFTEDAGVSATKCLFPGGTAPTTTAPGQVKYCGGGAWLVSITSVTSLSDYGLYLSRDNAASFNPVTELPGIYFSRGHKQTIAVDANSGRVIVVGYEYGTGEAKAFFTDNFTAWTPISLAGTSVDGVAEVYPIGSTPAESGVPVPDAPEYYIDPVTGQITGPSGTQISVCKPTLGEIVAAQCDKRDVTTRDVSELTDEVVGFRVASPSSPQKNIASLMPGYFFDCSEFDGGLHFPKRGGEDSFALTMDDLCERSDGDPLQWERTQEPELLRKLTVSYIDPDTTYTVTTQKWERRSGTVKAEGEGTLELPVVGTKDWAAQAAHMNGKASWAEPDKCTFHASIAQAKLVTAAVGTITDEQGTVHRVRIERIKDEGLKRMVEARRTRADVYQSSVTGASKPLPRFPGSNIRGSTDGLLLNMPVVVDSNDVPGIAWAAAGYLGGWVGTVLQIQRAGQWVEVGRTDVGCAMGALLADLPAHAGDIDTANVLRVRMNEPLESVTFTNLLQERNPLAIVYPDGTTEIVQFQTATETSAGEYELTTLLRGRLNTEAGDHAAGARVVFLDTRVKYAALQPTDIGTTLAYRFISMGTDPDAAPVQTLDLTTMESQREWPVFDLAVSKDGDDYTLTWRKRDRLGTDVFPIRSANWRGYEVSWSYGGNTHTETVLTESVTFNLPGASDITFSVAQINLYTGAGPAETVEIP